MVIRKRLIIWLVKAYLKKSGRSLVLSFFVGLVVFFLLIILLQFISWPFLNTKTNAIGIAGTHTIQTLPSSILDKLGYGLTIVSEDGVITPGLASSWEIKDNGKTYIFHLQKESVFHDGKKVESSDIQYGFSQASVERPNKLTIIYKLKDPYAPFLVTVSEPVFRKGFIGTGRYKVKNIVLNGDFIKSMTIVSRKGPRVVEQYIFYTNQETLKLALLLGEISQAHGLTDTSYKNIKLQTFPNSTVMQSTNYHKLITLFYNTKDSLLSDKKMRNALSLALPESFVYGERVFVPFAPQNIYFDPALQKKQDLRHSKELMQTPDKNASAQARLTINIKTLPKYKNTAIEIAKLWKRLDIETSIEDVKSVPPLFQIYLGDLTLPHDPDQYTIWHSDQKNNITKYKNLRVDKLLEDGRKTTDLTKRKEIYRDFQKYLLDDSPAAFLYFPYEYNFIRK